MKRLISLLLALTLLLCMAPAASAATTEATQAAETLYALGLFRGTGTNADGTPIFDLDKTPTRNQAIIMLVRLLGKENEALAGTWKIPFTDVADSVRPYVGYAYANGLTNGYTATTYCGTIPIRANQYITFVLRALGYESGKDFNVGTAWEFSDQIGLTDGRYNADTTEFLRGDVAMISAGALSVKLKGSNVMLLQKLYNQMSAEKWAAVAKTKQISKYGLPAAIGKTTLTYQSAYALVGKDPAVIASSVKTAGDLLQYMIAANFADHDVYTPWYGSGQWGAEQWGFDAPGKEQVLQNYGCCCGGFANLALYLLDGDYEESGIIRWLGGGNHTINYVRANGKYYVFDLTQYVSGGYSKYNAPVTVLDRLEDYYAQMPAGVYPKSEITVLVAIRDVDINLPWCGDGSDTCLILPAEAKDNVSVIYTQNAGCQVSFRDITIEVPLWNTEKTDLPARNTKYDSYESVKEQYIRLKSNADVALLRAGDGMFLQDGARFGGGLNGDSRYTVTAGGQAISAYTVESSSEAICTASVSADGTLILTGKSQGICTIRLTYQGYTAKFYYAVGYDGIPPFDAYISSGNA